MTETWDFGGLRALFINCTLKRSPEVSNTQALVDASRALMERHGVSDREPRLVDHDVATGVWPDMTEHGWATDEWPRSRSACFAADILVLAGPIWLGDNSSVMKRCIERLYATSSQLNPAGQYAYYGARGGLPDHRQRGRHQALRDEHPLQPAAPRLRDPAAGRRRLDRRGRPGPVVPRSRIGRARRTTSRTATRRS